MLKKLTGQREIRGVPKRVRSGARLLAVRKNLERLISCGFREAAKARLGLAKAISSTEA